MYKKIIGLAFAVGMFSIAAPAFAATVNVPADFSTIQAAIDSATTTDGDIVQVAAGTYTENPNITKGITLQTSAGAAIVGKVTIAHDSVTVSGFDISNPSVGYGIVATDHSNLTISNNNIHDIGTTLAGGSAQAVYIKSGSSGVSSVSITGNTISNVGNTSLVYSGSGSAKGIFVGDSNGSQDFNTVTISGNIISGVAASGAAWPAGRGAYGILVNHSTLTAATNGLVISGNTISNLDGLWAHAIGLEGNTPSASVSNNTISNLVDHKTPSDAYPITVQDNLGGATVTFSNNTLDGNTVNLGTATVAVDASYAALAAGTQVLQGTTYYYVGTNAFGTVQGGVAAVSSGGTINVAAGTYTEAGQIVISKDLSIVGADKTTTTIKPDQDTSNVGHADASAWFLVNSGYTFNLSKVTIDGQGKSIAIGILSHGHGTIDDNLFTNIGFNQSGPDYKGMAIELYGSDATVSNNSFSNIGRIGVFNGFGANSTITGNTYTGKGAGDWLDYGFEVGRGSNATITNNTVSGNTGVASVDGSTSAGILVTSYFNPGTPSGATISNNTLTGNTDGIAVGYDASDVSVVTASNNAISGNSSSGITSTAPSVDAARNWWGNASGPTAAGNPAGTGDVASSFVGFTPWCLNASCTFYSDNVAPTFSSTAGTAVNTEAPYTYNVTTNDPEADARTITAPTKPAWLTFTDNSDGTATLSGTPANADAGTADVTLHVADALGRGEDQSFTITVTDVTAPAAPTVTSPSGATSVNTATYSIAGTAEANSTVRVYDSALAVAGSATADGSGNFSIDITLVQNTANDFTVTATDSAGNESAATTVATITHDNVVPTVTQVTPVTTPTNDNTPAYTFNLSEASTVAYGGDCSATVGGAAPSGDNTVSFAALADGPHANCTVSTTDAAGNVGTLNVDSFTVDTTGPVATVTTSDSDSVVKLGDLVTITATFNEAVQDAPAPVVTVSGVDATTSPMTKVDAQHYTAAYTVAGTGNGAIQISVNGSVDLLGNVQGSVGTASLTLDNAAPTIDAHADISSVEATGSAGATVSFTAPDAHDAVSGTFAASCTPTSGSTFALGTTTVVCSATDAAGNVASSTFGVGVVDTTAPVITLTLVSGTTTVDMAINNVYAEPGYSASDIVDGTDAVVVSGTVDTSTAGTYTLNYNASDAHGNAALQVSRTVIVEASSVPLATSTNPDGTISGTTTSQTLASTTSNGISFDVVIPTGTVITGSSTWDGTLDLPTVATVFTVADNPPGLANHTTSAIELGSTDSQLTFDKGVRILFSGQAGTRVGWSRSGSFTEITAVCSADSQTAGDALAAGSDCKINVGSDLVVWTKHFTTFITYTQGPNPPTGSSGGGSGSNGPIVGGGGGAVVIGSAPATGGEVLGAAAYQFGKDLQVGSSGQDVTELQNVLIAEGFLKVTATGYFGGLTRAAVVLYQKAHGISPALGYVGAKTRAELNKGQAPATGTVTQTLTDAQVQAILGLLQSFGADQATIDNVSRALGK